MHKAKPARKDPYEAVVTCVPATVRAETGVVTPAPTKFAETVVGLMKLPAASRVAVCNPFFQIEMVFKKNGIVNGEPATNQCIS